MDLEMAFFQMIIHCIYLILLQTQLVDAYLNHLDEAVLTNTDNLCLYNVSFPVCSLQKLANVILTKMRQKNIFGTVASPAWVSIPMWGNIFVSTFPYKEAFQFLHELNVTNSETPVSRPPIACTKLAFNPFWPHNCVSQMGHRLQKIKQQQVQQIWL